VIHFPEEVIRLVAVGGTDAMENHFDFIKAVNLYWHYAQGLEFSVFGEPQIRARLFRVACKTGRRRSHDRVVLVCYRQRDTGIKEPTDVRIIRHTPTNRQLWDKSNDICRRFATNKDWHKVHDNLLRSARCAFSRILRPL
jgi:hypothetical protein